MHNIRGVLTALYMPRLLTAQYLMYGQMMLAFSILPLYAAHLGGDAWIVGLHTALFTGVGAVLRFWLGPLADTRGRRLPLLLGAFVFASTNLLLLVTETPHALTWVRAYQGIALAAYLSASVALVMDLAPKASRGMAVGLNRVAVAVSVLTFPPGAEQIVARWGFDTLFWVAAVAGFIGLALVASIPMDRPGQLPVGTASPMVTGLLAVLRQPVVPLTLVALGASALAQAGTSAFVPLELQRVGGSNYGFFFIAYGLASFMAGFMGGLVDSIGSRPILLIGLSLLATAGLSLYLSVAPVALVLAGGLVGFALTLTISAAYSRVTGAVPEHLRGTALALCENGLDLGIAAGFPLLSGLAAFAGYPVSFAGLAVLAALSAISIALQRPSIARRT